MADDGGVLENLPNSRPGKRSAKRERPAKSAEAAAEKAEAGGKPAADPARTSKAARTSAKPGRAAAGKASPKAAGAASPRALGAASPRGRTTAVKRSDSGDGVDVRPDIRAKGRHDPDSVSEQSGDAVGAVVRTAAGIAIGGAKVAGALTQELLRRLPRP
jgi:hypothetical protein